MNSSELPNPDKRIPSERHHDVIVPELPFRFPAAEFRGYENLVEFINAIKQHPTSETEEAFHPFEKSLTRENAGLIIRYAQPVYDQLMEFLPKLESAFDSHRHAQMSGITSLDQALSYREIVVPLAYRLGFYTLAPKIAQASFLYLWPQLNTLMNDTCKKLTNRDEWQINQEISNTFYWPSEVAYFGYSRPKTNHSSWRKIGSANKFSRFSAEEFYDKLHCYGGVVWMMNLKSGENRFDAILNGLREFTSHRDIYRSTHSISINMTDGFPVIMVRGVWHGIPVETQFLGGDIMGWLGAMDYGKYKVGTTLDAIETRFSPSEWHTRGNKCLEIYEFDSRLPRYEEGREAYHQLLLTELLTGHADYSVHHDIVPVKSLQPTNPENLEFRLPNSDTVVWQQTHIQVRDERSHL